jgi:hypothetical protein
MHHQRHSDHPVGDLGRQQVRQREVAEVVGADLALEPICGQRVRHGHDARPDRLQTLQVELAHLDVTGHAGRGGVALVEVAAGQDHVCADSGQPPAVTSPSSLLAPVMTTVRPEKDVRSAAVQELMPARVSADSSTSP